MLNSDNCCKISRYRKIGAYKLIEESDDYVGKSWVTSIGSTIFVYDRIRGSHSTGKKYKLACSNCSLDVELFPEILMHRTGTRECTTSCACSRKAIYSEEQQKIRCSRKADSLGVEFIGFSDRFERAKTKVVSFCREHDCINITGIETFFLRQNCCPKKSFEASLKTRLITEDEFSKRLLASGRFTEGTEFKRVGLSKYWEVHCPKCKYDEYAESGIQSIWKATGSSISAGRIQCRCSARHCWTKEEYRKRIEMAGVNFVRWDGDYAGNAHKDRFISACDQHGERSVSVSAALNGRGCPGCAETGFDTAKDGVLYCLKSDDGAFVKIGITNYPNDRYSRLKRYTPFSFSVHGSMKMSGTRAREIEKALHNEFMSAGFKGFDGATEWLRTDEKIINFFA